MARKKAKPPIAESPDPADQTAASEAQGEAEIEEIELSEEALTLVNQLQSERDEAVAARQRALADFVNYQRRASENERRAVRDGASRIVRALLPALDHFDLALNQDAGHVTVDQLLDGVRIVREELAKALQNQGVTVIAPAVGDEFDPNLHQAMMHQPTDELEPNSIVSVLQVGYAMGDAILRPASVSVAAPPEEKGRDSEGEQE